MNNQVKNRVQADVNLVIQDLQAQIANLSREKAVYYALAVEKEAEIQKLRKELETYKPQSKTAKEVKE